MSYKKRLIWFCRHSVQFHKDLTLLLLGSEVSGTIGMDRMQGWQVTQPRMNLTMLEKRKSLSEDPEKDSFFFSQKWKLRFSNGKGFTDMEEKQSLDSLEFSHDSIFMLLYMTLCHPCHTPPPKGFRTKASSQSWIDFICSMIERGFGESWIRETGKVEAQVSRAVTS